MDIGGIDGCIAVQARQTLEETRWLCQLADQFPFIVGVVGWADLRSPALDLSSLTHPRLVGMRHVVQDEPDDRFLLRPEFIWGIEQLGEVDLAYDLLIFPKQLPAAIELVNRFPKQRFVLDHIAKPRIAESLLEPWKTQIQELAKGPNVYCKISGMVTEARWRQWSARDFTPYLDVVWAAFGEDRLMMGTDWPVCELGGDYADVLGLLKDYLADVSPTVWNKIMGANAARFYKLKV
jgi:L-fuconolactonase